MATSTPTVTVPSGAGTQPALEAPAPTLIEYNGQAFRWKWDSEERMGDMDWYFDIKIFENAFGEIPYDILVAERQNTEYDKGEWRFEGTSNFRCGSHWAVQIAYRNADGSWAGHLSPESNRLPVGPVCGGGDGGGGDSGGTDGSGQTTVIK
jgi:hypothetical protein